MDAMEAESRTLKLVAQYLYECGYEATLESLKRETDVSYEPGELPSGELARLVAVDDDVSSRLARATLQDERRRRADDEQMLSGAPSRLDVQVERVHENIHSGNMLSISLTPHRPSRSPSGGPLLVSGGADKCVAFTDARTGERVGTVLHHKAGVLSVSVHPQRPSLVLSASMDGSHALLNVDALGSDEELVRVYKDHRKFVVRAKWSPDGRFFATASYDHTACLYGPDAPYDLVERYQMKGTVEGIAFLADASAVVIASRDDCFLHYVELPSRTVAKYNMNANGDDFVSFTILDVASHPSSKYVSAYTDRGRIIVTRARSNEQVANIYGLETSGYSQARHCWHSSGEFIFASTLERHIAVVNIKSRSIVQVLRVHENVLRDLFFDAASSTLFSAGYDHKLVAWRVEQTDASDRPTGSTVVL